MTNQIHRIGRRAFGFLALLFMGIKLYAQEPQSLALSWERTDDAPKEIILGLHCRSPFYIDWGDGQLEEFPGRNYGVNGIRGEYKGNTVRIYGNPNDFVSLYLGDGDRGNGVKSLDITRLKMLRFLHCPNNQLAELDLNSSFMLEELHLANNRLQSLSLRQCPRLDMLICYGNALKTLDLTENSKLQALRCEGNQIAKLDVRHLLELTVLRCGDNPISQLDLGKNTKMQQLFVERTKISSLSTEALEDLRVLNVSGCGFSQLDVHKNKALHMLYANNNALTELHITELPDLERLEVMNNKLHTLRLHAPILTDLRCSNNELQSLDLSALPMLKFLFCEQNKLTSIDLKQNPNLNELLASNNQLSMLNLSNNRDLYLLWLDGNQFAQLDITPCALQLFSLFLANNRLPLTEIQRIVNQLPDITQITASASKAWWKKWLRIAGNPEVERVDLTMPLKRGWCVDLKEKWPGNPNGINESAQGPQLLTQRGNELLLSAPDHQAVNYDIYTAMGIAVAHYSLPAGTTESYLLPASGCYIVIAKDLAHNDETVQKVIAH